MQANFLRAYALGKYRAEISHYIKGYDSLKIQIKAYDMWEYAIAKKYGIKEYSCHFERGLIAGIIESYLGKRIKIKEERCIATGDSYCLLVTSIFFNR